MTIYAIVVPVAYLLGATPWGYIIPKLFRGVDVRRYGSGNVGGANVQRTVGWGLAIVVMVLDIGKGVLAVAIAWLVSGHSAVAEVVAGIVAIIGHDWSVFLRFKGGRGVAVTGGASFIIAPLVTVAVLLVFVFTALKSRYVSLGSVVGALALPAIFCAFAAFDIYPWTYVYLYVVATPLIIFHHRGNIRRLIQGTERKLGEPAQPIPPPEEEGPT